MRQNSQKRISLLNFILGILPLIHLTNPVEGGDEYTNCVETSPVVSEVFCLPKDYRKDVPPPMDGPVSVYLKLPVSEISKIDDQRSQISLRLTYKIQWPEPRMILNKSADWSMGEINVRGDMVDHFWTPDIIIHDLVSFYKPEVLNHVAALEIKSRKLLYYKVRSDLTTVCNGMKFHRFPLDEHTCFLQLTSFGYDDTDMVLNGEFSYDTSNQRALPFNVRIEEISGDKRTYQGFNSNYSVYGLSIHLSRCVSPYLLNVYLPTAIFVVMSWVSFLIPTDVVPARIVLLVTLCLVIINTFNNVTTRIPVASQVTALEIWLLACILLVFGALAEYAFILRQIIRLSRSQRKKIEDCGDFSTIALNSENLHSANGLGRPLAFKLNGGMEVIENTTPINEENPNGFGKQHQETPVTPGSGSAVIYGIESQEAMALSRISPQSPNNMEQNISFQDKILGGSKSDIRVEAIGAAGETFTKCENPANDLLMRRYQEQVDGKALVMFPLSFFFFNIAYWCHYLLNFEKYLYN